MAWKRKSYQETIHWFIDSRSFKKYFGETRKIVCFVARLRTWNYECGQKNWMTYWAWMWAVVFDRMKLLNIWFISSFKSPRVLSTFFQNICPISFRSISIFSITLTDCFILALNSHTIKFNYSLKIVLQWKLYGSETNRVISIFRMLCCM